MGKRALARKGCLAGFAIAGLTLLATALLASEIHQWRDADGRLHFGDAPPENQVTENLTERYAWRPPFEIEIQGMDYAVPPLLRERLSVSVTKIFEIYRQAFDIHYSPGTRFDIRLYHDRASFQQRQRREAPSLENPIGYYSALNNRITAWAVPDERALLALITHECSHAVIAGYAMFAPIWLNEGLAEYFAQLHVHGLTAEVPVARHWLQRLRAAPPDRQAVTAMLQAPPQAWYAANDSKGSAYALSWSLVWFLMDSHEGRDLIRTLLDASRERRQHDLDSTALIDQHWPGGAEGLYQDWRTWLPRAGGRHRY